MSASSQHFGRFYNRTEILSSKISVKYSCLRRQYGCKIIIVAKNKLDKTIFYSLIKVRSFPELESIKHLLNGMQQSIDTYHNIPLEDDSD